ncbi:MAG: translation initiation factor IF-3 [Rickettsiales bacterium]
MSKNLPKKNNEITASSVRLVDQNGEMQGIVQRDAAIQKASSLGLDLVEIAPNSEPPVCKILDFGKFKYEAKKKKQLAKKKQKNVELKEIKLRPNIGENDLNIKIKQITKFLTEGHKVKITVRFRGREITHNELGINLANTIVEKTEEISKPESEAKVEGRQVVMVLAPNK